MFWIFDNVVKFVKNKLNKKVEQVQDPPKQEEDDGYYFKLNNYNPDVAIVITLDNNNGEMFLVTDVITNSEKTVEMLSQCFMFTLNGYLASTMLESLEDWSGEYQTQEEFQEKQKFMSKIKAALTELLEKNDKNNLKTCVDASEVFK